MPTRCDLPSANVILCPRVNPIQRDDHAAPAFCSSALGAAEAPVVASLAALQISHMIPLGSNCEPPRLDPRQRQRLHLQHTESQLETEATAAAGAATAVHASA